MKKIITATAIVAVTAMVGSSYAAQSTNNDLRCLASEDYCLQVEPGSADIHDAKIQAAGKANGHYEAKTLDWQFWEDGRYGAGVNDAAKNLDFLHVSVLSANGKPVTGGANCEIVAVKGETGIHSITLNKNSDGSIACIKN